MAVRPERRRQAIEELVAAGPQALQVLAACLTQDGRLENSVALAKSGSDSVQRQICLTEMVHTWARLLRLRQAAAACHQKAPAASSGGVFQKFLVPSVWVMSVTAHAATLQHALDSRW